MDTEHQFIIFISAFVGYLAVVSSLSASGVLLGDYSQPENPLQESVCDNIGGWDAVGDVVNCVSQELGKYLSLIDIRTRLGQLNLAILTPLGLGTGWLGLKLIRGN